MGGPLRLRSSVLRRCRSGCRRQANDEGARRLGSTNRKGGRMSARPGCSKGLAALIERRPKDGQPLRRYKHCQSQCRSDRSKPLRLLRNFRPFMRRLLFRPCCEAQGLAPQLRSYSACTASNSLRSFRRSCEMSANQPPSSAPPRTALGIPRAARLAVARRAPPRAPPSAVGGTSIRR